MKKICGILIIAGGVVIILFGIVGFFGNLPYKGGRHVPRSILALLFCLLIGWGLLSLGRRIKRSSVDSSQEPPPTKEGKLIPQDTGLAIKSDGAIDSYSPIASNEVRSTKVVGFLKGGLEGYVAGWGCMVPLGFILLSTGIGAIIGIPVIFAGILAPFLWAIVGLTRITGKCPYCGYSLNAKSIDKAVNCETCEKRIIIKDNTFIKLD